jgi:spore coat polysaccharide biosynthesis predicted glycosyltransferase SpsG
VKVIYRADGGPPIGTGHLFRASRLLKSLSKKLDLNAVLVYADHDSMKSIVAEIPARCEAVPYQYSSLSVKPRFQARSLWPILESESCDLIIVDMLDTDREEMQSLSESGIPIVSLDDRGEGRLFAHCLINILIEEPEPGNLPPHIRLLEGGKYVSLDPQFIKAHRSYRSDFQGPVRKVFVALGGADAAGLSLKVAKALLPLSELSQVVFLCGPAYPHRESLRAILQNAPWKSVLLTGLPTLIEKYQWCDLAIVAGGLTMYEVCCVGAPALAVCQSIDHQIELAERLTRSGAMQTIGEGKSADVEQITDAVQHLSCRSDIRRSMSASGPEMVDGYGTDRVAEALIETAQIHVESGRNDR